MQDLVCFAYLYNHIAILHNFNIHNQQLDVNVLELSFCCSQPIQVIVIQNKWYFGLCQVTLKKAVIWNNHFYITYIVIKMPIIRPSVYKLLRYILLVIKAYNGLISLAWSKEYPMVEPISVNKSLQDTDV